MGSRPTAAHLRESILGDSSAANAFHTADWVAMAAKRWAVTPQRHDWKTPMVVESQSGDWSSRNSFSRHLKTHAPVGGSVHRLHFKSLPMRCQLAGTERGHDRHIGVSAHA